MNIQEIKSNFEKALKLKAKSIKLLGKGASNVNYLIKTDNNKFIFRINANARRSEKSKKEFNSLKMIEKLNISPKPIYLGKNFIIISYIEGNTFFGKKATSEFLKELAKLVAKIHSLNSNNHLPIEESKVTNFEMEGWFGYIRENIENPEFLKIILETKKGLEEKQKLLKKFKVKRVISHGDICEQNILQNKEGLALIDFEDFAIRDPADDIAKIFVDFKEPFNEPQKRIFLEEYLKLKKDKTIRKRIEIYEKLIIFIVFVWSIDYYLRIKNKEMHTSFLNKKELKKGLEYTNTMFKRAIKFGIIDKKYSDFNIENALK